MVHMRIKELLNRPWCLSDLSFAIKSCKYVPKLSSAAPRPRQQLPAGTSVLENVSKIATPFTVVLLSLFTVACSMPSDDSLVPGFAMGCISDNWLPDNVSHQQMPMCGGGGVRLPSRTALENEKLIKVGLEQSLKLVTVPRDGSCLFSSLCVAMQNCEHKPAHLCCSQASPFNCLCP